MPSETGRRDTLMRAMRLAARARLAALLCGAALLVPSVARADRTDFLIDRLQADDFRVRTNAALSLGATDDDRAVQPLCRALDDSSEVVRSAAAVALKRLARSQSSSCLKARLGKEKVDSVKLQISRALESVGEGGGAGGSSGGADDPPKHNPKAKYYIQLSPVTNGSKRSQAEVDRIVQSAIRQRLEQAGDYQLAPRTETPEAARKVLSGRKLKGYYLTVRVEPFDYASGIRARVKMTIWRYPDKSMIAEVSSAPNMPGGRQGDTSSEDAVLAAAAGAAADQFTQSVQAMP